MNKKGFLLFEVMVSIVIVTTGLLFIMHSYSTSKKSIEKSKEVFKISLLLESKMWEYEAAGEIAEERDSGDFEEEEGYSWEVDVKPVESEDGLGLISKLNALRLSVFEEKERKSTEYAVSTYLFKDDF